MSVVSAPMPAAATYKVKRKTLGSRDLPPLVDKLATFVGKQMHGSLGWFEGSTLDEYLDTTTLAFDGTVPRIAKHEAGMPEGKRAAFGAYGADLAKQGHPLAAVIATDVAAMAEPKGKRLAKQTARATFQAYVKEHLAPRYSRIANNMIHFTDPVFPSGMGFRYGFLEELDTFDWTPAMVAQARELLADDHARWALDLIPRAMTFDDLAPFAVFPALRRLNFRWSKIARVKSLEPLADLRYLQALNVSNSAITDLSPLRKVPIVQLYIYQTAVVDLSPLAKHPTLECIRVEATRVSDVRPLMTCPRLVQVGLRDTKVSANNAQALRDYVRRIKAKPLSSQTYLIDGYSRGVSHEEI
jgi:hypothetical protein